MSWRWASRFPRTPTVERPKYKASQLVSFYEKDGKEVFHSFWQNITSLHGLLDEKYPSERLEKVLKKYMGEDTRLSEAAHRSPDHQL